MNSHLTTSSGSHSGDISTSENPNYTEKKVVAEEKNSDEKFGFFKSAEEERYSVFPT